MKATLTVAAAVAAIALSPVASAAAHQKVVWVDGQTVWIAITYPTDAHGSRFITDTLGGDGRPKAHAAAGLQFTTDTLAPGGTPVPVEGYRLITDTLAPGGGTSSMISTSSPGFSWGDAGVGAAGASGVLLLLAGAGLFALRRRRVLAF